MGILEDWRDKVGRAEAEAGLALADQMLGLQGQVEQPALQRVYAEVLLELLGRAPNEALAAAAAQRLGRIPCYQQEPALREQHGQALVRAVAAQEQPNQAAALVRLLPQVQGYGASLPLQLAHGEALEILSRKLARVEEMTALAAQLQTIPSFRDCPELQLACARIYTNATALAKNEKQSQALVQSLQQLPGQDDPRMMEALDRARRNQQRLRQLEGQARPAPAKSWKGWAALAGLSLVSLGTLVAVVSKPAPTPSSTPRTSAVFTEQLAMAQKALAAKDFNAASAYARLGLEMATEESDRRRCLELLIQAHTQANEFDKALTYYAQLPPAELEKISSQLLEQARTELAAGQLAEARRAADQAEGVLKLRNAPVLECQQLRAQILEAAGQLVEAAEAYQQLGDTKTALRLLEKARAYDKLVVLYADLGPEYRAPMMKLKRQLMAKRVTACESLIATRPQKARSVAQNCLAQLRTLEGSRPLQARCYNILARVAYNQAEYREAVSAARESAHLAPGPEATRRLKAYRQKDLETVTVEDLDISEASQFEFPPAVKTRDHYTYLYYLMAPGYSGGKTQERVLQGPKDEFKYSPAYNSPERGISFHVTAYDTQTFLLQLSAGRDQLLQPGVYEEATRFPFNVNNPGIEFSAGGGYNKIRGKFIIHEISWGPDKTLTSCAADFLQAGSGGPWTYGKIRYYSPYK